jgi:CRISP-associated protein Cas1
LKQLLNTLFVTSQNSFLSLENDNVLVHLEEEKVAKIPLINLENILYFGFKGATPALLGYCADRNISFCSLTPGGKFLFRVVGKSRGNVLLRREQYRLADDPARCCEIAKYMITGKIGNSRSTLMRAVRDHALSLDIDSFTDGILALKVAIQSLKKAESLAMIRGIEGKAAAVYFSLFNQMVLANKDYFTMNGRNKRPPLDPVNAILSFCYTLLAHDCASALESVGLDSYVGFIHSDRPGRESLALDLMEELRSVYADRFVLTLINNRRLTPKHFAITETGAVLLKDVGRKIVLQDWQKRKQEKIEHPFIKEKMAWGLVPYVQALLLAKYIRRDLEGYPAFLWG